MENNLEYQEIFERSGFNTMEEVQYKINSVIEAHPQEYGWVVGQPEVIKGMDGKYTVRIPLKKYSVVAKEGRLR